MTLLQPNRIKYRKSKITRHFTNQDLYELIGITLIGFLLGIFFQKITKSSFKFMWIIVWIACFALGVILILPNRKNNCKNYVLLWRMFLFWIFPKKYGKNSNRETKDLNPYSCLVDESTVQNKLAKNNPLFGKSKDKNYFSVFKLSGLNIWNEDEKTREAFIYGFATCLNTIKAKVTFVKMEEKQDFSENIKYILNKEKNTIHKSDFWKQYYEYNKNDFIKLNSDLLTDAFYIIINSYKINELNNNIESLIDKFNLYNISLEKLSNKALLMFLNRLNLFNVDEDQINNYLIDLESNFNKENSLDDLFSYETVEFKNTHFIINGNNFYRINCLNKLPYELNERWIRDIFNAKGMCIWNNFPYDTALANKNLDKSMLASIDNSSVSRSATTSIVGTLDEQATVDMIYQINRDEFKLFNTNFFVINKAESLKDLNNIVRINKNIVSKNNIKLNDLWFRQFFGLMEIVNYPFEQLNKESYQITSLNLALGWPFENDDHNDKNNMLLGFSENTKSPISFKLFDLFHSNRTNFNMFVNGKSGAGKTTFTKKLLVSLLSANNKITIIDPQAEYLKLAKDLGGQIVDLGTGKETTINPLQVRNWIKDDDNSIVAIINNHISWLETYFKTLIPEMKIKNNDWILLQSIIKDFYEYKGLYKAKDIKEISNKEWPIMSDLIKFIKSYKTTKLNNSEIKEIAKKDILDNLTSLFEDNGRYEKMFNGHTNIELNNDFVVFNTQNLISGADDIAAKLGTMCLLNFVNEIVFGNYINNQRKIEEYKIKHNLKIISTKEIDEIVSYNAIIVDEAHLYIDPDNPIILKYMVQMTKTVRKFNAGMIFTTQNPGDFTTNNSTAQDASRIIQNCQYSVFFGLKDQDIDKVQILFKNSNQLLQSEIRYLSNAKYGKCLFAFTNNKRIKLEIFYNKLEQEMFFNFLNEN